MLTNTDIETSSGSVRALTSGSTGPAVLFVHGNSGSAELFRPLLASPSLRGFQGIAISLPGHGGSYFSGSPERDYCAAGLAASIVDVVEHLALGSYVVVAHSLGGHAVATALPRLRGLLGVMFISAPPINLSTMARAFKPDPTGGAMFKGELSELEQHRLRDTFLSGGGLVDETARGTLQNAIRSTDARFRPALLASIIAGKVADERAHVESAEIETCLVFGRRDPFLQPPYQSDIAPPSPFAGGTHCFVQSGHFPHLDATERFGSLLREFLGATVVAKNARRAVPS
jgi:pimeloyl-ACP methyl ester carboxylesterase